ncbi:Uncharacterised protein [Vibrio cholerae]|nr:Uncharacterised protein [Vibrio cholerae]
MIGDRFLQCTKTRLSGFNPSLKPCFLLNTFIPRERIPVSDCGRKRHHITRITCREKSGAKPLDMVVNGLICLQGKAC